MSVVIKGLNKFHSCRLCPFNNSDCYCNITKGNIDRDDYSCEYECPIVQLPNESKEDISSTNTFRKNIEETYNILMDELSRVRKELTKRKEDESLHTFLRGELNVLELATSLLVQDLIEEETHNANCN